MAVSCGWNMPSYHRLWLGIITVLFIFVTIVFNVLRWVSFAIKYVKLNYKRFINRRKAKKQRAERSKIHNLISVETERGLIPS